MAFVHEEEKVLGKEIDQAPGPLARFAVGKVAGIILDPVAKPYFPKHLEVVFRAHPDPLGLQQEIFLLEPGYPFLELGLYGLAGGAYLLPGGDVLVGWVDAVVFEFIQAGSGNRIDLSELFHLIPPELDSYGVLGVGGEKVHDVSTDPEKSGLKLDVVAAVEGFDQSLEEFVPAEGLAFGQLDGESLEVLRGAQPVNAGDTGYDDGVPSTYERARGGQPQPLDFLVHGGVLLDIGVGRGNVGLGLVIVVVADEVFDRILGEEGLELGIKLGREGLVVGDDEGGSL